ncbi:UNVERIFIED_CONTAM: nitroreductase family protein [Murimonas intestini]|uniref:Nitroreductase family protein n=2 Tax=Murimonas intestini TaxID=1337051 RepID=A0AB73TAW9_9FIRM
MVSDKAMQKSIGFDGQEMTANITMASEDLEAVTGEPDKIADVKCGLDVLTAIKTRQSIRNHFIVIRDRCVLSMLAQQNSNAAMLEFSAGAIIVCGDKNREGIEEFLYADCAAAAQNILLCIHGLGLGGVWCGVVPNSDWRKLPAFGSK